MKYFIASIPLDNITRSYGSEMWNAAAPIFCSGHVSDVGLRGLFTLMVMCLPYSIICYWSADPIYSDVYLSLKGKQNSMSSHYFHTDVYLKANSLCSRSRQGEATPNAYDNRKCIFNSWPWSWIARQACTITRNVAYIQECHLYCFCISHFGTLYNQKYQKHLLVAPVSNCQCFRTRIFGCLFIEH